MQLGKNWFSAGYRKRGEANSPYNITGKGGLGSFNVEKEGKRKSELLSLKKVCFFEGATSIWTVPGEGGGKGLRPEVS